MMHSRIGTRPNGYLLLKKPQEHFEIQDFIDAIGKWSKAIENNPVPDFASKIQIKQVQTFPIYHVHSVHKYENRKHSEHREYASPDEYSQVPGTNWQQINLWDYNLKEQDKNYSVILDDSIYSENCRHCNARGLIVVGCGTCEGSGRIEKSRNENDGRTTYYFEGCGTCRGSGRVEERCSPCNGYGGFVNYIKCHVEYKYPVHSKYYCHEKIIPFFDSIDLEDSDLVKFNEVRTAKDFVGFVEGDIKDKSIADFVNYVNDNDSNNQNFLKEKTEYFYSFSSLIHFKYEGGGEYSIITYGENKVFAPDSPVTNSIDSLLSEANQCLNQHDFESTSKILKHIEKMNQKTDIINSFIERFRLEASNSLFEIIANKKIPELRKFEIIRAAKIVNNNKLKSYSLTTEIFSNLLIPFMMSFVYINFNGSLNKANIFSTLGILLCSSFFVFGIQFYYSRKDDVFYKKIWKYIFHGVLLTFPIAVLSSLKGFFSAVYLAIVAYVVIIALHSLSKKFLDDSFKMFKFEKNTNVFTDFLRSFSVEIALIKEKMPTDCKYISEDSQNKYIKQARMLEKISEELSQDEDVSYFSENKSSYVA